MTPDLSQARAIVRSTTSNGGNRIAAEASTEVDSAVDPVDKAVPLRLVTWNLNHWRQPLLPIDSRRAAWAYLDGTIGAQVALVQEAVPPLDLERDRAIYGELAGHRNWGSAVVALDPAIKLEPLRSVRIPWSRRRYLLENTHPGAVAIARLTVGDIEPITLVSVYGVMDGSAVSTMLRVIADLVPLFDSPYGARVILGGDLNVSRSTKDPKQIARAEAVMTAIRSLGLVEAKTVVKDRPAAPSDCPCGGGATCDHVGTWGRAELDHLFVSPALADQVNALTVDPTVVGSGLSDHLPLILDLALSPERTPHTWDEESFAEEIGRRHGASARDVIEKLINWADQKERELAGSVGVRTKTLTRFPMNGCTTEPQLWFPVDLELVPKGSQPTIAVRARGDVVIQFGGMKQPPFDSIEARDELRLMLNEIDGVDIGSWQLSRWPTIQLAVLEDPASLSRVVAVLDRIAVDSRPAVQPDIARSDIASEPEAAIS